VKSFYRSIWTLAFVACVSGSQATSTFGSVIVSEYFYNLNGSEGANQEWIEITNTGASTVDLTNWSYGDSQDNMFTDPFPSGTELLAGESAVIVAQSAAVFQGIWGSGIKVITATPGVSLSNSASPTNETIALRDASMSIVDEVNYEVGTNGWPTGNGASIFLLPGKFSAADNDIGANWATSVAGTLGAYQALTINPEISNATMMDVASPGKAVVVPEPATATLAAFICAFVGLYCRRRTMD
jgi:Lamin Tail Domain